MHIFILYITRVTEIDQCINILFMFVLIRLQLQDQHFHLYIYVTSHLYICIHV